MKKQKGNTGVIVSFIIIALFLGLIIFILLNKDKEVNQNLAEKNITEEIQSQTKDDVNILKDEVKPQKNTMEKIAKNGDVLVMNYTGRLTNGTVFDSNVDPKFNHVEPFKFTLGAGQVIKGWDEGLLGMKIGEKKTLTIPPEKGYGSRAVSTIPANSTLIFDVELVGIE